MSTQRTYAHPAAGLVASTRTTGTPGGDLVSSLAYDGTNRPVARYSPLATLRGSIPGSGVAYTYAAAPADNPCTPAVEQINQGQAMASRTSPAGCRRAATGIGPCH
ncbi:MAG: hypothetical protein ACT4OS_00260 [Acidimicrobiales bacterium]